MPPAIMDSPARFIALLLRWFSAQGRDLPWRKDYEPYQVWISEIMLQQTQMDRAVAYFNRWMERFPDLDAVAGAGEEDILKHWEGLGYYNRARNLHAAARAMQDKHQGRVPSRVEDLEALPGIGRYTARAVAAVAYNRPVLPLDANGSRVLARVLDLDQPLQHRDSRRALERAADLLAAALAPDQARDMAQALMELGALACGRDPKCAACPVAELCAARKAGRERQRPVPGPGKDVVLVVMATGVLLDAGRAFIQKRLPDDVWAGLWEFPGGVLEQGETPRQALAREFTEETGFRIEVGDKIGTVRYAYTRFRVTMHGYYCAFAADSPRQPVLKAASQSKWVRPGELGQWAFPAGHRKLMGLLDLPGRES